MTQHLYTHPFSGKTEIMFLPETPKEIAEHLFEVNLSLLKPAYFSKEMQEYNNKYWQIHGKKITKNKLIKQQKELLQTFKSDNFVNALMFSFYDDSHIRRCEEILQELENIII